MILTQDLKHALRALMKQPGYLATAVLTLALGIGFSTATFSVVNAVLLRPLPYPEPDRLVQLRERFLPRFPQFSVSPGHYLFWRDHNTTFEGLAGHAFQEVNLEAGSDDPARVRADRVSGNFFAVLGVAPVLGRTLTMEDEQEGAPSVAVLSHAAWQRRFGGAADVVGRTARIDRRPVQIVGVMPESFRYPSPRVEMWVPLVVTGELRRMYGSHFMSAVGRLRPGVTMEQVEADMRSLTERVAEANPDSRGWEILLYDMQEYVAGDIREPLFVLFGAAALVLLIGCANVANLLLVRGAARQKELAIRSSIGASRSRLLRLLLVEQATLAIVSTGAGLLIAAWLLRLLLAIMPNALPTHADVQLDGTVLLFAIVLACGTPLLFGLLPALQASRPDLRSLMSAGGRQGGGALPARRTRTLLVVGEVALAMTLLAGAGLLMRSFTRLVNESPGFEAGGAFVAGVSLPTDKYERGEPRERFFEEFLQRVRAVPGVEAAALSMPMIMVNDFNSGYEIEGEEVLQGSQPVTLFYAVSSDFFDVMQMPLLRGRAITEEDRRESRRVIVINQVIADRHFPNGDAIGKRIRVGQGTNEWREIVGVVGTVKGMSLDERPRAQVYEPYRQHGYFSAFSLVVRTGMAQPTSVVPGIRSVLRNMDPELPLAEVRTLEDVVDTTIRAQRFSTTLIGVFGGAALLLAAVGVYAVIAYTVGLRRQEFAIRVAHGARPLDIIRLVLRGATGMSIAGIAIGFVAAWQLRGALQAMLFNVSADDASTYVVMAGVLGGTALLASAIPALRATRVDPVEALRGE